jgi:hypothetical protein
VRLTISISALLVGVALAGCGGGAKRTITGTGSDCPAPPSTQSAGNADVSAHTIGTGPNRKIVIRVKDKKSGVPLHKATVSVQGTMTCPHLMQLAQKDLHEASTGSYKGDYNLFMPGQWTVNIVVRSKQGDATTSALPVTVKIHG